MVQGSLNRNAPPKGRALESVEISLAAEPILETSIHPKHYQPQTLTDSSPIRCELMGSFVPEYQKYEIEFLANMGPHSALPARPNGTTRTGDRSTCLGRPARKGLDLSLLTGERYEREAR